MGHTWHRIRLTFISFSFPFSSFFFPCLLPPTTHTMDECGHKILAHTMDEHGHKILAVLVFSMSMHHAIAQLVSLQWVTITQHWSVINAFFFFKVDMSPIVWSIWNYETMVGYMKNRIFGSFLKNNVLTTYKVKLWHISCLD